MNFRRDLDNALAAAMIGSNVMMSYYEKDYKEEDGTDPHRMVVTEADAKTQEAVLDFLLARYWPKYGIFAEEGEWREDPSRFECPFHWQVDPIDGALGFYERTGSFGISIALVSKEGRAFVGVLHNPARHLLAYACAGAPAVVNNQPVVPSQRTPEDPLRIMTWSFQVDTPEMKRVLDLFPDEWVLTAESNVAEAISVFTGEADMSFGLPGNMIHSWDLAAMACIAQQSSCVLTDFRGEPIHLNREASIWPNGFILSNGLLHGYAVERLAEWRADT